MGIGGGTAALVAISVVVVVVFFTSPAAGAADQDEGGLPCFHACFDQCVPRDEFWFCQLTCYHRCAGGGSSHRAGHRLGCEDSCAQSLCGRLRPGSKVMTACLDTCRKSYALAACTSSAAA